MIDSLTQSVQKVKLSMDSLVRNLNEKVEAIDQDLIESLDNYTKHYKDQQYEYLKEGTQFWNNLHSDRTNMLFAKENYFNQVTNLQNILAHYYQAQPTPSGWGSQANKTTTPVVANEAEDNPFVNLLIAQDKKFWQQYSRMESAKNEYERNLAQLNMRIDVTFD